MSEVRGASSIPPVDPRVGRVLGERYALLRKIGQGGMGAVYEAEHLGIHRRVAVKVLEIPGGVRSEAFLRFQREAHAATAIGHANIVEVMDFGRTDDGLAFMVLELLHGESLVDLMERAGVLPVGRIVRIAMQICEGLGAAHAKGIVHRDLKPDNVFLLPRGDDPEFVKILDFGISKFAVDPQSGEQLTQTGTSLGTPVYMSPEQIRARKDVDGRSDIWALGVIVFRALTGYFPFDADNIPLLVVRICTEEPFAIGDVRADLPPGLDAVVTKMLAKNPAERFQTCAELFRALAPYRSAEDAARVRASFFPRFEVPEVLGRRADDLDLSSAELDIVTVAPKGLAPPIVERDAPPTAAREPGFAVLGDGDAFAPPDSWLADASSAPVAAELADVTRTNKLAESRARRAAANAASTSRATGSDLLGVVARVGVAAMFAAIAVGLLVRGTHADDSILQGGASLEGRVRDAFALFSIATGVLVLVSAERGREPRAIAVVLTSLALLAFGLAWVIDLVATRATS